MEENSKYKAIDLGLSVKWANMNIGATNETGYGDYFAWGETEPYYVNWEDRSTVPTQWKDGKSAGYVSTSYTLGQDIYDSNKTLKPEYDVAHVKMGGNWRMPTKAEINELLTLSNSWTTVGGVRGRLFQGNGSGAGNTLFIPASGCLYEFSLYGVGVSSLLWGSSRIEDYDGSAYYLYFDSNLVVVYLNGRAVGFAARGVVV